MIAPPSNEASSVRDINAQRNGSKKENGLNFEEGHKPKSFEYEGPKLSVNGAVSLIFSSIFYSNRKKELAVVSGLEISPNHVTRSVQGYVYVFRLSDRRWQTTLVRRLNTVP